MDFKEQNQPWHHFRNPLKLQSQTRFLSFPFSRRQVCPPLSRPAPRFRTQPQHWLHTSSVFLRKLACSFPTWPTQSACSAASCRLCSRYSSSSLRACLCSGTPGGRRRDTTHSRAIFHLETNTRPQSPRTGKSGMLSHRHDSSDSDWGEKDKGMESYL